MDNQAREPHSAGDFGISRMFWWNEDFLRLMSERWGLESIRQVLDVGCGLGHWSLRLLDYLPDQAELIGIDREASWVSMASELARQLGIQERMHFRVGLAEALDFPDETFDMVTCQTVLIHLKDPSLALQEMKRVLKPGGLIVVIEPNNLIQALVFNGTNAQEGLEEILARVRFQLMCERGKERLGEGCSSIGDRVPGLMAELGFKGLQVFQSDKTSALFPPYETVEQSALARIIFEGPLPERWIWSRPETLRFFLAGGGSEAEFERMWSTLADGHLKQREAYFRKDFHQAGGKIMYLISATK
ncbi:MAG TPA: class I SAM-dependent methyltransferase [Chroococcales cyanobacterium]